jgi:ubiquitin fusion degradation protein 1
MYNNKVYEMSVLETKPADAVSVIECDLNVDFAPPVGYKEPEFNRREEHQVSTLLHWCLRH